MAGHFFFVGPGRVGLALGHALQKTGEEIALTYCGRGPEAPPHPLFTGGLARYVFGLEAPEPGTTAVFLSVPDGALSEVAAALADRGPAPGGCVAFHLSGALGTDCLAPLRARGYPAGTLHPLQAVADPVRGAELLPGSFFALSGDPEALAVGRRILRILGSPGMAVPVARRPLYHAAAVFASNYLVGLVAAAARLMSQAGVPEEEALAAILPLARGSLRNLEGMGPSRALTGPISRGDAETVRLHLRALEPRERALYLALGREILELAREGGLGEEGAMELTRLLEEGR